VYIADSGTIFVYILASCLCGNSTRDKLTAKWFEVLHWI